MLKGRVIFGNIVWVDFHGFHESFVYFHENLDVKENIQRMRTSIIPFKNSK